MNRIVAWLLLLSLGILVVRAREPDLQAPPSLLPTNAPRLSALLVDSHGEPIASKRSWRQQRARLKERWESFLGEFPKTKVPLKTEVSGAHAITSRPPGRTGPATPHVWWRGIRTGPA